MPEMLSAESSLMTKSSTESDVLGTTPSSTTGPEPVTSKELHELQDRFAIIPLYTKHHKYALNGEYMIDHNTGASAIKLENGKIIMDGEEGRAKYHAIEFENNLRYYGMRNAIIKRAVFDNDSYVHTAVAGENMLDDPIYIDDQEKIKKLCISLDLDVLSESDDTPRMVMNYFDPDINVKYSVDMGEKHEFTCKLSNLGITIEELDTISLVINEMTLLPDVSCALDNSLILIHSILIGVLEEEI